MTPNDYQLKCCICDGKVSNTFQSGVDTCVNCGTVGAKTYENDIPPHAPSKPNPNKGTNTTFIPRTVPVNASYNAKEARRKNLTREEKDDIYQLEFDACRGATGIDSERKQRLSVDEQKGEVMKSCLDLAIDG